MNETQWTALPLDSLEHLILHNMVLHVPLDLADDSANEKIAKLLSLKLRYKWHSPQALTKYQIDFLAITVNLTQQELMVSNYTIHSLIKRVIKQLAIEATKSESLPIIHLMSALKRQEDGLTSYELFFKAMINERNLQRMRLIAAAPLIGNIFTDTNKKRSLPQEMEDDTRNDHAAKKAKHTFKPTVDNACKGCGRLHKGDCALKDHPNFNKSNLPWRESTIGKRFAAKGISFLPSKKDIDNNPVEFSLPPRSKPSNERSTNDKGTIHPICSISDSTNADNVIMGYVMSSDQCHDIPLKILLDTGALKENSITRSKMTMSENIIGYGCSKGKLHHKK
jgi:hypothetical protein